MRAHFTATWNRVWYSDPIAVEKLSSVMLWGWAIMLALPFDTFWSSDSYTSLRGLCTNELWWAVGYAVAAALQTVSTCFFIRYLRFPSAIVALLVWSFTAIMMYLSNPRGTAGVVYAVMAASQAWVVLRGPIDERRPLPS